MSLEDRDVSWKYRDLGSSGMVEVLSAGEGCLFRQQDFSALTYFIVSQFEKGH